MPGFFSPGRFLSFLVLLLRRRSRHRLIVIIWRATGAYFGPYLRNAERQHFRDNMLGATRRQCQVSQFQYVKPGSQAELGLCPYATFAKTRAVVNPTNFQLDPPPNRVGSTGGGVDYSMDL